MNELASPVTGDPAVATTEVVDVSVIIVNYNVCEFLEQALQSVYRAAGKLNVEIFVVDNDSADGSAAMVRRRFPDVRLIVNDENSGFSRANNQGIREALGRYLLILNPDTILQEDTLDRLAGFLDDHPDAGAVGCQILNPDGSFAPESRRAFPTPRVAFFRISGLSRLFPSSPFFGRYNMTFLPQDEIAEVDALSGSCMMVRHAALYLSREEAIRRALTNGTATGDSVRATEGTSGAGLFDEDFFMYGEDLDWCYRIQQAGWKIFYTPETRIIHFKGESTKKGELRYVRLFYGAMVKFAQKHFDSRYSWSFTLAIRSAILARATLGVGARLMRRLSQPILEASLVFLTVSILGASLLGYPADAVPALFYGSVAGGFSLIFLAAATLGGAYRRAQRRRLKPVWKGLATALILLAALSFFIKDIAYSRLLLLTSFLSSGVMLSAVRLSIRNPRSNGDCRVLLVGDAQETSRLEHLLAGQPSPPFILVGYVSPDESEEADSSRESLGPARQLRDIVRLHRIDDVVFASRCVSNFDIFRWMQQLHDLPVQFRILAAEPDRIIGKSSIDEFVEPPLISAHEALHSPRSRLARRAFEVPVALTGLLLLPVVRLAASATSASHPLRHLARKTGMLGSVVTGSRALVGYDSSAGFIPPIEWNLKPGVFSVTDTMSRRPDGPDDLLNAYWFYTQHQSASMDWDIILKCLRSANR